MKTMRKISSFLFVTGLLLIAGAAFFCISNLREERTAGKIADDVAFRIYAGIRDEQSFAKENDVIPDYLLNPDMSMPEEEIDGYSCIGYLSIPTLDLELPIMEEWSYPGLKIAPGRYAGSAYNGSFVICGHNYKTHFGTLHSLSSGDLIVFTDMDGNEFVYSVDNVETIEPNQKEKVLSDEWALTLFTCTPGGKTRVVVHCMAAKC